jgi:glycosyltransferase involved in cell wall biosynthesis
MANFGFIYCPSDNWIGGKNYYLSLFNELSQDIGNKDDKIFIFSDEASDLNELKELTNIQIVRTKLLSQVGLFNLAYKVFNKIIGRNALLTPILNKYKIDVLSHSYIPPWTKINCLPWIPDFQHCLLECLFSPREIKNRNNTYKTFLDNKNFLLSSYSALEDAKAFYNFSGNASVYRFYPMIAGDYDYLNYKNICNQHDINQNYVFLPNQFWKHKNHLLCFEACKLAKASGNPFKLVCTGGFSDYRHPEYSKEIKDFIKNNDLQDDIVLLGLVERNVLNCLLKECTVLVNPSKFEGWSTTVEEGKALKKTMALSSLTVHKEQCAQLSNVSYFDVDNAHDCCKAILEALTLTVNDENIVEEISRDKRTTIYEILLGVL